MGRAFGVPEAQLRDLHQYETSPAFEPIHRAVLDLAVAMAGTPADVPDAVKKELDEHFDLSQQVELASAIAWEHYRARFNRAFGVAPAGFVGEGAYCVLPERPAAGD